MSEWIEAARRMQTGEATKDDLLTVAREWAEDDIDHEWGWAVDFMRAWLAIIAKEDK